MTTLENLASGYKTCAVTNPLPAEVLAALAASVTTQQQITRISQPIDARTVDLSTLSGGEQNVTELTFTNNTAVKVVYWITPLFNQPGDAVDFGLTDPSAFDFPAAQGGGAEPAAGGSQLRVLNKQIENVAGIVGRIEITTSNVGGQKNERLIINTTNFANDACNSRRLPPLCPACPENGADSDIRVILFACPLGAGGFSSFGYPVLPGETVTIRIHWIAQEVQQFKTLINGDCAC